MNPAQPQDSSALLHNFRERYSRDGRPIPVDFRRLVPRLRDDSGLNNLHSYPAKLLRHIPQFFLSIPDFARTGCVVLDPFCGSGTVLLEARLAGLAACGADSNPLARMITLAKTTPIAPAKLARGVTRLFGRIPAVARIEPPEIVNAGHWFYPHVIRDLTRLLEAIRRTRDLDLRRFFSVVFSSCIRRVSLADPRVPVPVRLNPTRYPYDHPLRSASEARLRKLRVINVDRVFREALVGASQRLASASAAFTNPEKLVHVCDDARDIRLADGSPRPTSSIDLVITSPPYLGAQKYIRSCSLSLNWLGLCTPTQFRQLEDRNIGREHFPRSSYDAPLHTRIDGVDFLLTGVRKTNPLRAHIAATYLVELQEAFTEIARVLAPGGHLVLVLGENLVASHRFDTTRYADEILKDFDLERVLVLTDEIRSRGLLTKRHTSAGIIQREHISIYKKIAK